MRILYIVNVMANAQNPSAEPFVKTQIESVRRTGVDVEICNVRSNESKLNYIKWVGKVRGLVQRDSFDLVHGHYVYSGWIAALQNKIPSVVSFMGSDLLGAMKSYGEVSLRGHFDATLSMLLTYFADGIIVKSDGMGRRINKKRYLAVIPNGVDFNTFKPLPREECRRKIGLGREYPIVLFVGKTTSPNKGYALVKEAVGLLKNQDVHCELLVAQGIPHHDIPLYMNASDVLVLASQYEGSPNVVKEAMACNLPIVATDVGDIREVIEGIHGCKIVKRDPIEFSKAIKLILATVDRTTGRKAIEHLRIEKVAQRLVRFYESFL